MVSCTYFEVHIHMSCTKDHTHWERFHLIGDLAQLMDHCSHILLSSFPSAFAGALLHFGLTDFEVPFATAAPLGFATNVRRKYNTATHFKMLVNVSKLTQNQLSLHTVPSLAMYSE